jgi:hypothetical protein
LGSDNQIAGNQNHKALVDVDVHALNGVLVPPSQWLG